MQHNLTSQQVELMLIHDNNQIFNYITHTRAKYEVAHSGNLLRGSESMLTKE